MMDKIKVLYIDDEQINLQLFEVLFSDTYDIHIATSGFEALTLLEKQKDIQVVFCDMCMPQMNGLEFIIKAREKYQHISFNLLSGYEITAQIKEALQNKVVENYFMKPFDIVQIEAAIHKSEV
jgi:CheY-like chemotaxis protein